MQTDAVIIGAGHNGLAVAAGLAKKGWQVAVIEAADRPGGAVKTRAATLPGFLHDMGAMNLSLFAGSAFHKAHGAELASHGLAFVPAKHCFASLFPDGRWLGVSTDLALTRARIAGFSAKDAAAFENLLGQFGEDAEHIFAVLGSEMRPARLARLCWKIWRAKGTGFLLRLLRLLLQSPRQFLDSHFESPEVKACFAAWGMHLDFPPDQAGGALFPYLETMANQAFGMVIGKNGAACMIDALAGMITAHGGSIECKAEVTEIITRNGRATGVRLADGRLIEARRAVIANIHPRHLTGRLLPAGSGDAGFDKAMADFSPAPGTMMIHLALNRLPDWMAAELKQFAYVHLAPSMDMMAKAYQQARAGLLPDEPVLVVGQPSVLDPGRAPAGQHTLWVQVRMVPAEIKGDAAGRITARDWPAAKQEMADRVLDIIENYAPGLRRHILGQSVVSPADLEADNRNLIGGDQITGSHHLAQNFLYRPAAGWPGGRTPVTSLHLVGAGVWPGAGVGAGSASLLLDRLG